MQVLALDTAFGSILLPVSTVAQIINRSGEQPLDHALPFVRTKVRWQGLDVPLVYSSEMLGGEDGSDADFARAVVLWPMRGSAPTDLFALSSRNSPNVVELGEDSTADLPRSTINGDDSYTLGCIVLGSGTGIIPDLKLISRRIFNPDNQ